MSQQLGSLNAVFDLMDRWRHLPTYQLERRADLFFAAFLPRFLQQRLALAAPCDLLPEFPVRIGTIYPNIDINSSFKIDYVAVNADRSRIWFVELKTDSASRRDKQDKYLAAAQSAGMPQLLEGIIQIFRATAAKHKYFCLLQSLESAGLLRLPGAMHDKWRSGQLIGITALAEGIEVACGPLPIDVLYVQPRSNSAAEIGFDEIAGWLLDQNDPLATRFAESLRRWVGSEVGRFGADFQ